MSWVIKEYPTWLVNRAPRYFTGAGFSWERKHAVRFTYRHWAVGMLTVIKRYQPSSRAKIVHLRRRRNIRCKDACCPCLKVPA